MAIDQSEAELQLSGRGLDQWEARIPLSPSSSSICAGICSSEISTETQHCSRSIPSNLPIPASGGQTPALTFLPGFLVKILNSAKLSRFELRFCSISFTVSIKPPQKPCNPASILPSCSSHWSDAVLTLVQLPHSGWDWPQASTSLNKN